MVGAGRPDRTLKLQARTLTVVPYAERCPQPKGIGDGIRVLARLAGPDDRGPPPGPARAAAARLARPGADTAARRSHRRGEPRLRGRSARGLPLSARQRPLPRLPGQVSAVRPRLRRP